MEEREAKAHKLVIPRAWPGGRHLSSALLAIGPASGPGEVTRAGTLGASTSTLLQESRTHSPLMKGVGDRWQ